MEGFYPGHQHLHYAIVDQLVLSINTIRFHVANIFQELGLRTRTQAVQVASERGILSS